MALMAVDSSKSWTAPIWQIFVPGYLAAVRGRATVLVRSR